jgi:hypothetical protein
MVANLMFKMVLAKITRKRSFKRFVFWLTKRCILKRNRVQIKIIITAITPILYIVMAAITSHKSQPYLAILYSYGCHSKNTIRAITQIFILLWLSFNALNISPWENINASK